MSVEPSASTEPDDGGFSGVIEWDQQPPDYVQTEEESIRWQGCLTTATELALKAAGGAPVDAAPVWQHAQDMYFSDIPATSGDAGAATRSPPNRAV